MDSRKIESVLRDYALGFPEAYEEFPWGERAIKVKGKVFVFMGASDKECGISVKLPQSRDLAFDLPFAEPTHYGLGKHGWVTAHIKPAANPPIDLLKAWIEESFRAIAPKNLNAQLDAAASDATPATSRRRVRRDSCPPRQSRGRRPS